MGKIGRGEWVERERSGMIFRAVKIWWWVALVAVTVVAVGFSFERIVAAELRSQVRRDLQALRDTNVGAVEEWMAAQERAAQLAVTPDRIPDVVEGLVVAEESEDVASKKEARLRLEALLAPSLRHWEFSGYLLLVDGRVLASDESRLVGHRVSRPEDQRFLEEVAAAGSGVTRPRPFSLGPEQSNVMWAASRIVQDGRLLGVIAFRLDPSASFTRILGTARFGQTGETYAYDEQGLLLSSSRFEPELRRAGLLQEKQGSALQIVLRDPGQNLLAVGVPDDLSIRPLTASVRRGIAGETGASEGAYRDYRGSWVFGAWTWLPRYGLGVVTEVDRQEALASSSLIHRITMGFVAVVLLLVLGGLVLSVLHVRLNETARVLGQYTLESKIGEGGMGSVYRARHALLRRPTAIKMIKGDDIRPKDVERFKREVQSTARLSHPNTISVYDYGQTDTGVFYYAMEYLQGANLHEIVKKFGPLPQERVIHLLIQLLGSLAEAHSIGFVHRDVKPGNLMLCVRGGVPDFVTVVDFGLVKVQLPDTQEGADPSRLTAFGSLTGTPHYMAPEAIVDASQVDARSDLYAVGALGFFALTGREVFSGGKMMAVLTRHLTEEPPAPSEFSPGPLVPELDSLVLSCLAKSQEERPQSALAMLGALERIQKEHELSWTRDQGLRWWKQHGGQVMSHAPRLNTQGSTVVVNLDGRSVDSSLADESASHTAQEG